MTAPIRFHERFPDPLTNAAPGGLPPWQGDRSFLGLAVADVASYRPSAAVGRAPRRICVISGPIAQGCRSTASQPQRVLTLTVDLPIAAASAITTCGGELA
jgi:hypothetical protein